MTGHVGILPPWQSEEARFDYGAWRTYLLDAPPETIRELVEKAILPADVLVCVLRSILDDNGDSKLREKAVGVLVYAILGSDLVPARVFGPVGVLDDLWLLLGLLNDVFNESDPEDLKRWWPGSDTDLKRVAKWIKVTQKLPKNLVQRGLGVVDGVKDRLIKLSKKLR